MQSVNHVQAFDENLNQDAIHQNVHLLFGSGNSVWGLSNVKFFEKFFLFLLQVQWANHCDYTVIITGTNVAGGKEADIDKVLVGP